MRVSLMEQCEKLVSFLFLIGWIGRLERAANGGADRCRWRRGERMLDIGSLRRLEAGELEMWYPASHKDSQTHTDMSRNFNISGSDLYDLFGKYGPIRQIRLGNDANLKTKGTAYVVYESPDDASQAQTHLNGFHLMERYIVGESRVSLRFLGLLHVLLGISCSPGTSCPCLAFTPDDAAAFPSASCIVTDTISAIPPSVETTSVSTGQG
jgi:hypothetical protein